ncbi:hypothetical protein [uncultured Roseobacter sp.]|uniref:hypothetical protein n=1 Tax=uncultured Roseobacter sp. TaxID=114847 RepID=UPI002636AE14|nr:hypothetical protein [uncultured Roseobacter sp.]
MTDQDPLNDTPEPGLGSDSIVTDAGETPKTPTAAPKRSIWSRLFGWIPALGGGVAGLLKPILPGVILVGAIALAMAVWQGHWTQWPDQLRKMVTAGRAAVSEPVLPGVLSIEPPQLYTRERLVNDRFRQANWLEQQLAKTKGDQTTTPVSRERRSQNLIATLMGATQEAQNQTQTATTEPVPVSALQQLSAVDKMRLRLRTDLMDTLLDDGHDLEGNTLYRLNFDAVVMPLINRRSYPGTAVFIIEARDPYTDFERDCIGTEDDVVCNAQKVISERSRIVDDVELLRGWQREIQQFLTKVLDARIEAFRQNGRLHNPVDPKENIALDWFLRRELISSFLNAVVYDPEVLALCRERRLVHADITSSSRLAPGWASACKDWIAETIGFDWSTDNQVPTVKSSHALAPLVQAGFRKAIRRAHYINTVLAVEGQMTLQKLQNSVRPSQANQQNMAGGGNMQSESSIQCAAMQQEGTLIDCPQQTMTEAMPEPPMDVGSMPQDEDYKRALVRLISVWQGMEEWGRETQFGAMMQAAFDPQKRAGPTAPAKGQASAPAEFRLLAALTKFDAHLPTETDIAALRKRLREEGAQNFVLVRGQATSYPQLRSTIEQCSARTGPAAPSVVGVYKCLIVRSEAAYASNELMSHFLLARLQEELSVYDRESRSIRDFLEISLEGCSTTGCRIQVSQHKDLPGNEVFGAREAGFLPAVQNRANRSRGEIIPARLYDVIDEFKVGGGGVWGGGNWKQRLTANCIAKNVSMRTIRLSDAGLKAALQIVDQNLSPDQTSKGCEKRALSYETRQRLEMTKSCLGLAKRHANNHEARTEIYLSCMLRDWINTQRSDVTVYAVSPRAGDGDDLAHRIDEASAQLGAALPAGSTLTGQMSLADTRSREQVVSNPRVIGFSHLPGSDQQDQSTGKNFTDRATFGWAIRPRPLGGTGGYQSSHHRLSAVISLPSWWKRVDFDVRACWVQPPHVNSPAVDFTKLCRADPAAATGETDEIMPSMRQFRRNFEIKLPRRVEEITARFNFDFIRAPYYYREFDQYVQRYPQILSLEAGRPGKLVLQGERLWRGTVVTVDNQSADSIVVLPDMKGVVAHFNCVHPPDGMFHFRKFDENLAIAAAARAAAAEQGGGSGGPPPSNAPGRAPSVPLFVWTSEGGTTDKQVEVHPFVQRWADEKPCWLDTPEP